MPEHPSPGSSLSGDSTNLLVQLQPGTPRERRTGVSCALFPSFLWELQSVGMALSRRGAGGVGREEEGRRAREPSWQSPISHSH